MIGVVTAAGIVVCAGLLIIAERRFPYTPGQSLFRSGFWNDLVWYGVLQSYILGLIIPLAFPVLSLVLGSGHRSFLSVWPIWAQVAFFIITHDFYIYWMHRAMHRSSFLWRLHEAHHSTADVDWLSGVRSHPFEILINQTIEFAPIVLLAAAPEVSVIKSAVSAVWGMYIHSNIDVRSGVFQFLINGPEMHRLHHSADPADGASNFATKLAVWDWIFRTARRAVHKPAVFGLADKSYPRGYLAQCLYAFRSMHI